MHRPLGLLERFTWMIAQTQPVNVVLVARTTGSLTTEQITQALTVNQNRHMLLTVRVVEHEYGQPYFVSGSPQIPLEVKSQQSEAHWQEEVRTELLRPFPWQDGPLVRLTLLQSADVIDWILTFDHAIADGLSAVYLLRDLLQAVSTPDMSLQPLPERPACEALYPYCGLAMSPDPNAGVVASGATDCPPDWTPQLLYGSLSEQETTALVARCRQEQTTVHGALSAAFLRAIASEPDAYPRSTLKCLSMINLRNDLVPPITEEIGSYIAAGVTYHASPCNTAFWNIARHLKQQLNQRIQNGQLFEGIPESIAFWSTHPDAATIYQIAEMLSAADLVITNLGSLHLPRQFGQLQLQHLYLTTPGLRTQTWMVGAVTFQGQVFMSVRYLEPIISKTCAERISQKARQQLIEAIS